MFALAVVGAGIVGISENCTEAGRERVAERERKAELDSIRQVGEEYRREAEERNERLAEQRQEAEEREAEAAKERAGSRTGAIIACQEFIERQLVSPASADHPWSPDHVDEVEGRWAVRSHVDSENRFGAKIRIDYQCLVEHAGDERYTLLGLQADER